LDQTREGDFVLVEMGHNDNGDPRPNSKSEKDDEHRSKRTLPGTGKNSVKGVGGEVFTFGEYLRKMISDVTARKAVPVLSGMVPTNVWEGERVMRPASKFPYAEYSKEVAKAAGPPTEYLDHTKYSVKRFSDIGQPKMKPAYFPNDNTHTSPAGARCRFLRLA
jgi:rhamnogalacturonan acetylesterase